MTSHAAVLIGVGEFTAQSVALKERALPGTVNDVFHLSRVLTDAMGINPKSVTTLIGVQATKDRIVSAIRSITSTEDHENNHILIYFSGHGVLVPPRAQDPKGFIYKALVPSDVRVDEDASGLSVVPDSCLYFSDLKAILNRLKRADITFVIDACHSGIAARGRAKGKSLKVTNRISEANTNARMEEPSAKNVRILTACRADEIALEGDLLAAERFPFLSAKDSNVRMSYLTYHFVKSLKEVTRKQSTWETLWDETKSNVINHLLQEGNVDATGQASQHPESEGVMSKIVFGGARLEVEIKFEVQRVLGNQLEINNASRNDLAPGFILQSQSGATARVEPNRRCSILGGQFKVGESLEIVAFRPAFSKLRVAFDSKAEVVAATITRHPDVERVEVIDFPDIIVHRKNNEFVVFSSEFVIKQTADTAEFMDFMTGYIASRRLITLENQHNGVSVKATINGFQSSLVTEGSTISLSVSVNKASYIYIFDIDARGTVSILFPNQYHPDARLSPSATLAIPNNRYSLVARPPLGIGYIKVIASESPLDLPILGVSKGQMASIGHATSVADQIFNQLNTALPKSRGLAVSARALPVSGWGAATALVRIEKG